MKFYKKSIRYKMIAIVLGMSIPTIVLFFFLNTYAVDQISRHLYENNRNLMLRHMKGLEAELNSASELLIELSINNLNIADFSSTDIERRYNATIEYHNDNKNMLRRFALIEGHIAFSPVNQNLIYYSNNYTSEYKTRVAVAEYIKKHAAELVEIDGRWQTICINNEWILLSAYGNSEAVFCFWADYKLLIKNVQQGISDTDNYFCFIGTDGTLLSNLPDPEMNQLDYSTMTDMPYFIGPFQKYMVSGIKSEVGDFWLVNVIERSSIQKEINIIRFLGIFLLVLTGAVGVPIVIYILNKNIFRPVDLLERGIHEVENGNFDIQIENIRSSKEIEHLIDSFNRMISDIHCLKIETYEKGLEQQKMELDYLNLQIEPHFYLNTLNVISVYAQIGDTANVCKMIEHLSSYMRYIMGSRKKAVTVKEELAHVNNYLKIVESRLGNGFSYVEQIDESLLELSIPPLMIQTLVENSMKYAFDVYRETVIQVKVERRDAYAYFFVKDNGEGFSKEYLNLYNQNLPPVGTHIGLINLRSRLKMMYGENVSVRIFNLVPQGACTEIKIYFIEGEEDEFINCR